MKYKTNKNKEIDLLNYQIYTSLIVIITVFISIILTINEQQKLKNKKTIFNKKTTQNISYINRLTILITSIIFLYINYKLYEISKKEGEDLTTYYLQILASILTIIASSIALYIVLKDTNVNNVSDVENPII